jgi:hypothetical protein
MKKNYVFIAVAFLVLAGCATSFHRGVVAMKLDENTAHIGLKKGEASVGDHVELYGNKCTGPSSGRQGNAGSRSCEKVAKGHGTVTQILSENYVEVKFAAGVSFQEGDFIEKHSH